MDIVANGYNKPTGGSKMPVGCMVTTFVYELKINNSKSGYLKSEVKQAPPSKVSEMDRSGTISLSAHNLDLHLHAVALDQIVFRAIERLNGYPLYGSRIAVSLAKFNGRSSYWRKVKVVPERDGEKSGFQSKKFDVEILLSETSNGIACTVKKEPMVAGEVSFHLSERVTWVEIFGLPLHCWNQQSFKNIAEAWGSLEAVGENSLQGQSCEKVVILISTEQGETIDELVEFNWLRSLQVKKSFLFEF
ncbi:hypothetical protein V6N13_032690 [Hibiscus sabdariffa]